MAPIQNLFILPGQTSANLSVTPSPRGVVLDATAMPSATDGALTTAGLNADAISGGFENILEFALANAPRANAIDLKTGADLTAFLNSSLFPSTSNESRSLLTTTAQPYVKQGASAPVIDLLLAMQALQPMPIIKTENGGTGNIGTNIQGDANPVFAISAPVRNELAESVWPEPRPIEPVAGEPVTGEFTALTMPLIQPSDATVAPPPNDSAAPALHTAAIADPGASLLSALVNLNVAGDANERPGTISETNSAPKPTSEIDTGLVPPSQSNTSPRLTSNVAPSIVIESSASLPRGTADEAGNAVDDRMLSTSSTAMGTLENTQNQAKPIQLLPELSSQPTASLAPAAVIAPAPRQPDIAGKNLIASIGDSVTLEKKPGELQSAKSTNAGLAKEGLGLEPPPIDAHPAQQTTGALPGNAIAQSIWGDSSQTPGLSTPSGIMAAPAPQPLAAVPNLSNPPALQDQSASSADQRGNDQPEIRNLTAPQPLGAVSAAPATGQSAAMAKPAAVDGQNFVQTLEQISGVTADATQQASEPDSPDMIPGAIGNTVQIDKQDALRAALPQTSPRSEPNPSHISPPIRDISVHISQHVDTGMNRFQLRLDPPELGRVEVRMEISPEGKLSAVIAVERPETLDLLQRDSRALEKSLADAGLKTDSNSLSFSLKGGRRENQDTDGSRPQWGNSGNDLTGEWDEPIAPMAVRFANRSVNIRI